VGFGGGRVYSACRLDGEEDSRRRKVEIRKKRVEEKSGGQLSSLKIMKQRLLAIIIIIMLGWGVGGEGRRGWLGGCFSGFGAGRGARLSPPASENQQAGRNSVQLCSRAGGAG
jgi:hypothetical protein